MGNLALISSLLFFVIFSAFCSARDHQALLSCLQKEAAINPELLEDIYPPHSPQYSSLLNSSQKNTRWLNSTSQMPNFVIAPQQEEEIKSLILCTKESGFEIRVKSGGHDYEGLSFRAQNGDPFVMVDLHNLRDIDINLDEETAWIQTGVTLGQLYFAISQKSDMHAFPGGLYPSVGSGGHISGGDFGILMRKYGLAADNVLDARIMDVKGKILDRKAMGEGLFWALRGGGGASFGIILAWKLKLVQVPKQTTAFSFRRRLNGNNFYLLHKWQNIAHQFTDDLFMRVLIQNRGSGDSKIVQMTFNGYFLGTPDKLVPLLIRSFPEFGLEVKDCLQGLSEGNNDCPEKPCVKKECTQVSWIKAVVYFSSKNMSAPLDYLLVNQKGGGIQYKGKSDYAKAPIPDKGCEIIRKSFLEEREPMMILDPFGGRMSRIEEDESPFPHRKGNLFNIQYLNYWTDYSESNRKLHWIQNLHQQMEPFVASSPRTGYINYKDLDLGENEFFYAQIFNEVEFKHTQRT